MNKPEITEKLPEFRATEEEIQAIIKARHLDKKGMSLTEQRMTAMTIILIMGVATTQRDADAAYYEPLIQQFETIQKRQQAVEAKLNDVELAIQQAREEVAREIDDFLQMHLYARPDKPEATMKFTDWMRLKKLLSKWGLK